jgi:hypothetical protein
MQLNKSKLRGPVNRNEQVEFSFNRSNLSNINVEIANGVRFEFLPCRFGAFNIGQSADTMTLQATVKRRPCQMWHGWLQRIETIIKRQQRVAAESHDDCLVFD